MAMGDALAVCLLQLKNFNATDFAKHHPGGALGKKLYLTVGQIAAENLQPQVGLNTSIDQVLDEITTKRLGTTAVIDNQQIKGIVTDGDIRRMLKQKRDIHKLVAKDIMRPSPVVLEEEVLAVKALSIFEEKSINHLIVVDTSAKYKGIVHILDLIKEGISE
jgi:arabinose-5-phosphate isomerase